MTTGGGGGGGDGRGVVWFGMIHRRFGLDSWTRLCNSGEMSLSGRRRFLDQIRKKEKKKKSVYVFSKQQSLVKGFLS